MSMLIEGVIFDELASDPGSPVEGEVWYNTTANRLKIYRNGTVQEWVDLAEHNLHKNDVANPHSTDLEAARTAGSTLSGTINMGGFAITNAGAPTANTDVATKIFVTDEISQRLRGLDWQESVLDRDLTAPPGSPSTGDRYIVATPATGTWTGLEDQIVEWDGAAWVASVPNEGFSTRLEDENVVIIYDGASWGPFGGAVDHGSLIGLGDDDHTQYLLVDGTRAMAGAMDMGGFAITNVGNVDGVDVSAHASRHISAGADEVDGDQLDIDWAPTNYTPSTAPTEVTLAAHLTAHLAGIDNELANVGAHAASHIKDGTDEVDGDKLDIDFTPSNYTPSTAPAEATDLDHLAAHLSGIDTALAAAGDPFLEHKAGNKLAAAFSGKTVTVTFSAAFADANYAVTLSAVTTGSSTYLPVVQSQAAGSFVINKGSSSISGLTQVNWAAIKDGES